MEHITINSDRSVTVPVELRKIGVQYDHNVNTIEFVGPRYSGNVDLLTMTIYINYILSDKTPGKYKAENVIIDDQDNSLIRFNWTITRNVTKASGILSCLVCAKKTDEEGNEINHWNTDIFRLLSVSEGMENDSVIQEQYPDVITSLIQNVEEHDAKLLEFSGLDTRVTDIENNVNELKGDKVDKTGISLGKHTDGLVYIFIDGEPVGTGLDISSGEITEKDWYVWYMSNIAPIDGMYNSHSYSNVYVVGNELIVLYRSAPHHFSDSSLCKMRISRTNLKTFESTNEDLLEGLNYFGSVCCNGTYYIFDKSMNRYDTTDFKNFNKVAYTVPSGASEPYYITVGDNNRFISTHSNSSKKGSMMYSDDYGVTWLKATGDDVYNATLTTHGATTKVGNTLVAYCQASKNDTATNNETVLNVLISVDNGLTWTGSEVIDEDLKYCGPSFASGMFAQIGDEWFLCLSSRLRTTDEDGNIHLGNVRLFKGSEEDVINGTMSLYAVVDDFNTKCTSITVPSNVSMTDTGNIGMTTDGSNLYIVYAKPLMQQASSGTDWITSNSMLCMAVVNSVNQNIGKEDSYYNAEWETERDAFVEAKDVEHDLYIYGSGTTVVTNVNGIEIMTPETNKDAYGNNSMASGCVVPNEDIQIPFVDYFEMRMIFGLANRLISPDYHKHYYGINVDGIKHALTGSVNIYKFNESNSTSCAASLTTGQQLCDFKLKYEKGIVSATLNGITIDDVQSYVVTDFSGFNDTENTAYLTFDVLAQIVLGGTGVGKNALIALTVDTDGDISDLLGEIVVDPEIPVYTITNNLTNCMTTQTATEINEGSSYNATITANDGYILSEITCTMGGVEQAVTNGVIIIESVTGDIVINATATKEVVVESPITDSLAHWLKPEEVDTSALTWTDSIDNTLSYSVTGYDSETKMISAKQLNLGTSTVLGLGSDVTFEGVFTPKSSGLLILHPPFGGAPGDYAVNQNQYIADSTSYNYNTISTAGSTNFANKIVHVAFCIDTTNGVVNVYINGKLEGTSTITNAPNGNNWAISNGNGCNIGNVRIYNKALTSGEVEHNYQYEQGIYTFDTVN